MSEQKIFPTIDEKSLFLPDFSEEGFLASLEMTVLCGVFQHPVKAAGTRCACLRRQAPRNDGYASFQHLVSSRS
jgi:hypothetical protein